MIVNSNPRWREDARWQQMVGISLDDCINARGKMERGEPLNKKAVTNKNNFGAKKNGLVGFGKFRDLTYAELKEQQSNYYRWACETIDGFQEKAEKFLT